MNGSELISSQISTAWHTHVTAMIGQGVILLTLIHHLTWGWLLFFHPLIMSKITSLAWPVILFGGGRTAAMAYVSVSVLLILGVILGALGVRRRYWYFLNLIGAVGQQFLLMVSSVGCIVAIWQGAYLDGTVVPRVHLIGDQELYVLLALIHPLAVLHIFAPEFWWQVKRWMGSKLSQ